MYTLAGVDNVYLGICPYPMPALVCLVVLDCGAQNHDVLKQCTIVTLERVKNEHCFSATRSTAYYGRVWVKWEDMTEVMVAAVLTDIDRCQHISRVR